MTACLNLLLLLHATTADGFSESTETASPTNVPAGTEKSVKLSMTPPKENFGKKRAQ